MKRIIYLSIFTATLFGLSAVLLVEEVRGNNTALDLPSGRAREFIRDEDERGYLEGRQLRRTSLFHVLYKSVTE